MDRPAGDAAGPTMFREHAIEHHAAGGPGRHGRPRPLFALHDPVTTSVPASEPTEVRQVADAVLRSIALDVVAVSDRFFPAHLPCALIDAVFRTRLRPGEQPSPVAERYCRHFGIAYRRADRVDLPPAEEQETLADLVRRCSEHGMSRIESEVFRNRTRLPGASVSRAESTRRAAQALRHMGIDVLQDIRMRRPTEVDAALRRLPGIGEHAVRALLMYTGTEDFVLGDTHVRRFVASAVGERTVSGPRAEKLVRDTAYELILSPRYLEHQIWQYGVCGAGVARPPEPSDPRGRS